MRRLFLLVAAITASSCVGALMGAGSRGGSVDNTQLRAAVLTDVEKAHGCWFTDWNISRMLGPDPVLVLWDMGDGKNAGGLIEMRCADPFSPLGVTIFRACVYASSWQHGIYNKRGELIGCKR